MIMVVAILKTCNKSSKSKSRYNSIHSSNNDKNNSTLGFTAYILCKPDTRSFTCLFHVFPTRLPTLWGIEASATANASTQP